MNVNVQTIFWMDAFLYLMLHAAIWYGLARFRSPVVVVWSVSGICSALSLGVLGSRGWLSTDVVVVLGQFLMAVGNWGRQIALRSLDGPAESRWLWLTGLSNLGYLSVSYGLHFSGAPESTTMLVFYAYYTVNCLEYFWSGHRIGLTHDTIGATSVKWAAMVLTGSLGIKTLAMLIGVGATYLYDVSWDQGVVFAGQFIAIIMLSVGFMQIYIDKDHRAKIAAQHQLVREQERSALALQHSEDLSSLLREREELIRQLTLSNKSAGMGALVASFAHELNQPLAAISSYTTGALNMLGRAEASGTPVDCGTLKPALEQVIDELQLAHPQRRIVAQQQRMTGRELVHPVQDRSVLGHVTPGQIVLDRQRIDLAPQRRMRKKLLELRAEDHAAIGQRRHMQRLHAQPVARQHRQIGQPLTAAKRSKPHRRRAGLTIGRLLIVAKGPPHVVAHLELAGPDARPQPDLDRIGCAAGGLAQCDQRRLEHPGGQPAPARMGGRHAARRGHQHRQAIRDLNRAGDAALGGDARIGLDGRRFAIRVALTQSHHPAAMNLVEVHRRHADRSRQQRLVAQHRRRPVAQTVAHIHAVERCSTEAAEPGGHHRIDTGDAESWPQPVGVECTHGGGSASAASRPRRGWGKGSR